MIGEKITYSDLPDDGNLTINKKKIKWWDYYKFDNESQYVQWKAFAKKELDKASIGEKFDLIDMTYGLVFKVPKMKEGQLEMFP